MIDSHCHPITEAGGILDLSSIHIQLPANDWELSERQRTGPSRLSQEMMTVRLAQHLACAPEEVEVARQEASRDWPAYVRNLFSAAGLKGLVLDPGWDLGATTAEAGKFSEMVNLPVRPILRLEPIIDRLIAAGAGPKEIQDEIDDTMRAAPASGYFGFKTIIAYRTGLAVDPSVTLDQAGESLRLSEGLPVRRRGKALRDMLLRRALGIAAELGLPFQIHTGYGDSDIRLVEANPILLEELLRSKEGCAATILLIHGSYPWHDELAYLTVAKTNVYAELSQFNIFSPATIADRMERILEFAPTAKVLCGTDGHGAPETYWFAALMIQEAWSRVRTKWASAGARQSWLEEVEAAIFDGNTSRMYRF